ncbi:restriction endonuclease subunit S [Vibrio panuliri]|uniref:Type I restriction modification DNA specificity domain-containing protein n=1 Tax=Vibrio panuliri TaxID=1381081 RepID=A0ABX3FS53_9VIBR|nr:restriction endonuclease subunit S [Vibrio panuliri]KAB1454593.1 restriction endonuclease subunit S [Vibrio panuliri]OLQ96615.1 hypothetical protein BIY20_18410 [Vibrio panuliri]
MVPNSISKLDLVQAQISEIPEGWQLCKVSEALRIRNNFRKPISQEVRETMKGQYPYYGPTKIQDYISEYEQDGIYALIGEDGDHFLKYATMPQTQFISGKCTVNNHAHILESSSICDSEWFFNYFKHRNITNFLSRQGAGRFKLNKATLEKLPLLVPPLPEQRKIAQILSTWDKTIATTEKLIDASKQQKKALMQQLLTGKKRLLDPETGRAFEGDWEEVKLETAAGKIFGGGTPSRSVPDYWNGCIPWVTVKDLVSSKIHGAKEHISELGLSNSSANIVPKGHVIIATRMAVGKAVVATCNVAINQDLKAISPSDVLDSVFLHYWFMWKSDLIEGMGTGSTVKGVQISSIKSMGILLPAVPEQRKIASALTAADKEIELLVAKLTYLKQEKKALMQQLLTGKRRVSLSS